ncbi:amidohydrolase family protein [Hafnia sp. CBA7124]|uniref:metal-dependent hydrolase family protein n=1 Tax=Hafnia sp. CBA7124 TaxID=1848580 RepID=UPI000BBA7014|nr:amidohydrolase family protein [Hafnia sp. CBA7124]
MKILLKNANIFDGKNNEIKSGDIIIDGGFIQSITKDVEVIDKNTQVIDLQGKYVMPGLIDAHVHITASRIDLNQDYEYPGYMYARSFHFLKDMINRGFTSVRDAGGADVGIKTAVEEGVVLSPRLFISGRALSQTGGHGDYRHNSSEMVTCACSLCTGSSISVICDGVPAVRQAAREQFRIGASQIKMMAGGGISSPTDKIDNLQYSDDEIIAIVDEATRFHSYVMAHAYTPQAIIRCVNLGVKTIEHGNLLDAESAQAMFNNKAYLVPTLSIYNAFMMNKDDSDSGIPASVIEKLEEVQSQAINSINLARKYNVKIGLGTDLLGDYQNFQYDEFKLRSQVESAFDTLHSATYVNAEILNMKGKLGIIDTHAFADLIVLENNPLEDISVFSDKRDQVLMVIKNGDIVKNLIN